MYDMLVTEEVSNDVRSREVNELQEENISFMEVTEEVSR